MAKYLKIAAAQLGPIQRSEDRVDVVKRLVALMHQASDFGCKLVVFPELALTTFFPRYFLETDSEAEAFFEESMPDEETQPLFDAARRLRMSFYLGYAERAATPGTTRGYNTSILVGSDGNIIGKYRKIHLPGHSDQKFGVPFQHLEKRYFEVGNLGFPVWRALGTDVGMCICNDRRWPETFRVMALQSARLILLGYNTPTVNIHHAEPPHLRLLHHFISLQAAAYQNAVWIVASAKAGVEDGHHLHGGTCIIAPTGEIVSQAITEGDEVIAFNCDMEFGDYLRRSVFNFGAHRRIEHYRLITETTGALPGEGMSGALREPLMEHG